MEEKVRRRRRNQLVDFWALRLALLVTNNAICLTGLQGAPENLGTLPSCFISVCT